jgi:hypothetical protein
VEGPGGICWTIGFADKISRIMETDRGLVPELAVIAVFPSGLIVRPKGWGATTILLPAGVRILPLGIMVSPVLSIMVYLFSAGAEMIHGPFFEQFSQDISTTKHNNNRCFAFIGTHRLVK